VPRRSFSSTSHSHRNEGPHAETRLWPLRKRLTPYGLLLAALGLYAFVWLVPMARALLLSMQQTVRGEPRFVGASNYIRLVQNSAVHEAFANAVILIVLIVVPVTLGSFCLAVIIHSITRRAQPVVRSIILLPFITSPALTAIVFRALYSQEGVLNVLLAGLGLSGVGWLTETSWAKLAVSGMVVWEILGYNAIMMFAGLQRIPNELYEAAAVDGASRLVMVRAITFPLMIPLMLFVSVTTTFGVFNLFTEPLLLTKGGPGTATLTPGLLLYREAFSFGRFGNGAALGLMIAVVALAIGLLQIRLLRGRE
jgi:lactose/L-arabinose transport system permease protein